MLIILVFDTGFQHSAKMIRNLIFFIISLPLISGSLNDWQNSNPDECFVEDWLLRVTDFTYKDKMELTFGNSKCRHMSSPQANVSISKYSCDVKTEECDVAAAREGFSTNDLNFTIIGGSESDTEIAKNVRWEVNSQSKGGVFEKSGNMTNWSFRIGDLVFEGQAYGSESKESEQKDLWFLHKQCLCRHVLGYEFRLDNYIIQNVTSGETTTGTNGVVTVTQIWQKSSFSGWLLAEGTCTTQKIFFTISRRILHGKERYFIYYSNEASGMTLYFDKENSWIESRQIGKEIIVSAVASLHSIQIRLYENPSNFDQNEPRPESDGFPLNYLVYSDFAVFIQVFGKSHPNAHLSLLERSEFSGVTIVQSCL